MTRGFHLIPTLVGPEATMPAPRTIEAIDRDLKASCSNRESARREIRRLSDIVVNETRRLDALLAERSRATHPQPTATR